MKTAARINVNVFSEFIMSDGSACLIYGLYNTTTDGTEALESGNLFAYFTEDGTWNGRVGVNPIDINSAGDFEDTMVFRIKYVEPGES